MGFIWTPTLEQSHLIHFIAVVLYVVDLNDICYIG